MLPRVGLNAFDQFSDRETGSLLLGCGSGDLFDEGLIYAYCNSKYKEKILDRRHVDHSYINVQ